MFGGTTTERPIMKFREYQHLERFGNEEVQDIEYGNCYIFPKIDGTNSSTWLDDGQVCAGSRTRQLSKEKDNAGFFVFATADERLKKFHEAHPDHRLYGEWLVPHTLKTYRDECWRKFYVFDVIVEDAEGNYRYLTYEEYQPLLEEFGIDYIPPICIIKNPTYETLLEQLKKNSFLIKDGSGEGEGIVIKRYNYMNKYKRVTWAKIVTSEFKEKHVKAMGANEIHERKMVEEEIAKKYVTEAVVEKEYAKIVNEAGGWSSKMIPRLLDVVFYTVVKEDSWEFIKEHKFPTVNFKTLRTFVYGRVKELKKELF